MNRETGTAYAPSAPLPSARTRVAADRSALLAQRVMDSPGQPLDSGPLARFSTLFSHDFSGVRIHADAAASESARNLGAAAYTVGNHVVFGAGRYVPDRAQDSHLLAHELLHTLQQGNVGPVARLPGRAMDQRYEHEAESAAHAAMSGRAPSTLSRLPGPALQLQADASAATPGDAANSDAPESLTERAVERAAIQGARLIRQAMPGPVPETVIAALIAAEVSFLLQGYRRLVERGDGMRFLHRVTELADGGTALSFYERYVWGVLKGLASPVTGMIHLAVLGLRFQDQAMQWMLTQAVRTPELLAEARDLRGAFETFSATAQRSLASLRESGQLTAFAAAILSFAGDAGESFQRQMVGMARRKAHDAADSLVDGLLKTPLPELAETAGEIVGTVFIEMVLLLFTDGIGNLVTKIGEFARALRPLSRGVRAFTGVAMEIGRVVSQVEHLIGALLSRTVLRPLMPLFEALQPLLGRLQRFARRLMGLGEQSASALAPRAAHAAEEVAAATTATGQRTSTVASTPVSGGPSVPTPSLSGGGGRPPVRGATAEGAGEAFTYGYHPSVRQPEVSTARVSGARPAASAPPTTSRRPAPAHSERGSDVGDVMEQATGGTHRAQAIDPDPSAYHPRDSSLPANTTDPTARQEADAARRSLRRSTATPPPGRWQKHHLVPLELREHAAVYEYERLIAGIDNPRANSAIGERWMNSPPNNLTMPSSAGTPGAQGLTIHSGSHPQYTSWMKGRLDEVWYQYRRPGGLSIEAFGQRFEAVVREAEQLLATGRWGPRVI